MLLLLLSSVVLGCVTDCECAEEFCCSTHRTCMACGNQTHDCEPPWTSIGVGAGLVATITIVVLIMYCLHRKRTRRSVALRDIYTGYRSTEQVTP